MLVRWTERAHGDVRTPPGLGGLDPGPGVRGAPRQLCQVHGADVAVLDPDPGIDRVLPTGAFRVDPRAPGARPPEGDALVTAVPGVALAVVVADCAPVALGSPEGICGAVHAGWRGIVAGVLENAVAVLRALGATEVVAGLGPCAGPCCYEFGSEGIAAMVRRWGPTVAGRTRGGRPALDLPAAVGAVLGDLDVALVTAAGVCTVCSPRHFSYRGGDAAARQAMVVWRPAP